MQQHNKFPLLIRQVNSSRKTEDRSQKTKQTPFPLERAGDRIKRINNK